MIQLFNKALHADSFVSGTVPVLAYSCNTRDHRVFPRIMHSHDDLLEIVYVVAGSGSQIVQDLAYPVSPGALLGYNAGALHDEYGSDGAEVEVFCVGVANVALRGMPANHVVPKDRAPVCGTGDRANTLRSVFTLVHALTREPSDLSGEYANYLVRALLVMAYECFLTSPSTREPGARVVEGRIKRFLDDHYKEDIKLEAIAGALDLSPHHISHVFKAATGFSPIQYVLRRRIGEAQSLLLSTDCNVTEIAFQVGFNNSNHFQTMFAKLVGLTPATYRKYWSDRPR